MAGRSGRKRITKMFGGDYVDPNEFDLSAEKEEEEETDSQCTEPYTMKKWMVWRKKSKVNLDLDLKL